MWQNSDMFKNKIQFSISEKNIYGIEYYNKLELQGPTGPLNSSSCGGLARYAHKKALFAFYNHPIEPMSKFRCDTGLYSCGDIFGDYLAKRTKCNL